MGPAAPWPYRLTHGPDGGEQVGSNDGDQVTSRPAIWHHSRPMGGAATTRGVTFCWAAVSDVGRDRAVNEDAVLAADAVFVVADGMGGHQAGDVASAMVVDRFRSIADDAPPPVQAVVGLLDDVNSSILAEGSREEARSGMGTTAVGLVLVDSGDRPSWLLFNIGDSRAYRWADGELEQLSVDHSHVQELVDEGEIDATSARDHPDRHVITRALGAAEGARADLWLHPPRAGDRYLLCSDGLTSEVGDELIGRKLSCGTAEEAASALVRSALASGGRDNVTVAVVDVTGVDGHPGQPDTRPLGVTSAPHPPGSGDVRSRREPTNDEPTAEHAVVDGLGATGGVEL